MGQYTAIGITMSLRVLKKSCEQSKLTLALLQQKMHDTIGYSPDLYEVVTNEHEYIFTLKNDLFQRQLLPLLEIFYYNLYEKESIYSSVLDTLRTLPPETWMALATSRSERFFQLDIYGHPEYLRLDFGGSVQISYQTILLSIGGKIITEGESQHFKFIKRMMSQSFHQFELAKALRMYISG